MNYYLITCSCKSFTSDPIVSTMVISEKVEDFVYRNTSTDEAKRFGASVALLQWKKTTKAYYGKLKGNNPGSNSSFQMKKEDYSVDDLSIHNSAESDAIKNYER